MMSATLAGAAPALCSTHVKYPFPRSLEHNAENAPETGCNGFAINNRQCAEPLRVSGIYRGHLSLGRDRWGGEASAIQMPISVHRPQPASVLGTGDHDQP